MNSLRTKILDRRITRNATSCLQKLSTTVFLNSSSEIKIPLRKERGPTDILEALESTINRDPTAPDYKYMDDPFFVPTSLSTKRQFALAKESGKKAAMWIREQHPDLLYSTLSEPLVEAFLPPEKYEEKDQVSEEILLNLIKLGRVNDVLHIYKLLEGDVKKETKQAVLEMLCYYNSNQDLISEEFIEERSYKPDTEINKNMWINSIDVENLYGELIQDETTAAAAHNALICGTAKYLKLEKAMQLYEECLEKNIPLCVDTFNHVIQLTNLLKEGSEDRKVLILSFLKTMAEKGVKPNIRTLNAALKCVSSFPAQGIAKDFSLSLIEEFKSIGIEPSLASYYYLLLIFCRPNGPTSLILNEILDDLEKKPEIETKDTADVLFFVHAMEIASKHMDSLKTGERLHKLLLSKKNYKFIGGRLKESVYYRNYLQLLLNNESIEDFMITYNTLVPNIYIPEPAVMRDIIEMLGAVEKEKATNILPTIISQVVMFDMLERINIMKLLFDMMTKKCSPSNENSPLHKQFAEMAETLWNHIQVQASKKLQRYLWPAQLYGNIALLMLRGGKFDQMIEVLGFLAKSPDSAIGSVNAASLEEIFNACILRNHIDGAIAAIEYANEFGIIDAASMVKSVKDALPLSAKQENKLIALVGVRSFESELTQG